MYGRASLLPDDEVNDSPEVSAASHKQSCMYRPFSRCTYGTHLSLYVYVTFSS